MIQYGSKYEGEPRFHFGPVKRNPNKEIDQEFGACDTEKELEEVAKKIGDIRVSDTQNKSRFLVRR